MLLIKIKEKVGQSVSNVKAILNQKHKKPFSCIQFEIPVYSAYVSFSIFSFR
jgi:hypothetical protein